MLSQGLVSAPTQATGEPAFSDEQRDPGKALEGQDSKAKDMQAARRGLFTSARAAAATRQLQGPQEAAAAHQQTSETMVKRDINVVL